VEGESSRLSKVGEGISFQGEVEVYVHSVDYEQSNILCCRILLTQIMAILFTSIMIRLLKVLSYLTS
jgi:hypothetical protein